MLEQTANALTFYAFFVASKQGKAGLAVTVDVYKATSATPIVSGASATALGGGLYYYTLSSASVDAEGAYLAIFKTTDTTVDQQHIPALWVVGTAGVENLDAAVSSRASVSAVWGEALPGSYAANTAGARLGSVGSGSVTVVSPVSSSGDVSVRKGKDYSSSIGTALQWTLSNPPATDPTSVTFTCAALGFSKACSYASSVVTLQLTAAETGGFSAGVFRFEIEAVISSLKHPGLVTGNLTVEPDF